MSLLLKPQPHLSSLTVVGSKTAPEPKAMPRLNLLPGKRNVTAAVKITKPESCPITPEFLADSRTVSLNAITPISDLVQNSFTVDPDEKVAVIKDYLNNRHAICSVVIVRDQKPLGLLMSHHLDRYLGSLYGVSLYYHRSVTHLMDRHPLIVEADRSVGEVAKAAMQRGHEKIYDDVIVVRNQTYWGIVTVQNILNALALIETKAREAAESATKAKTRFLASMSHDIRTPMNAILGMAEVLSDSGLSTEQQHYVKLIRTAGNNLLELINDILDISKIEADQIELAHTPFNIWEMLEKECKLLAVTAHEKKLEFICNLDPQLPVWVAGDPFRLRRILVNLIGNALKFTQQGEIMVKAELIGENDMDEAAAWIGFTVADTGIGIPENRLRDIFKSYSQAHAASGEYGGVGLGLAISKHFVELMGGKIEVVSHLNQGATFYFTVKLTIQSQTTPQPIDFTGIQVIIMDDNTHNALYLANLALYWGAAAVYNQSWSGLIHELEALSPAQRNRAIMLLDADMPDMNGVEVAEKLHDLKMFDKQRIIMMHQSMDSVKTIAQASKSGIRYNLIKPLFHNELSATMISLLKGEAASTETDIPMDLTIDDSALIPLRLLLAEDNDSNRALFSFFLKDLPHQIDMAENGAIALEKCLSQDYDIVFMDLEMPIMGGYEATRAIRAHEHKKNKPPTPIIALTAHALQGKAQESKEAGCTEYIIKPYNKQQLLACLKLATPKPEILSSPHPPSIEMNDIDIEPEFIPLIPDFLLNTQKDIALLSNAVAMMSYDTVTCLGHRIKGAALCYGFNKLGEYGAKIEIAAQAQEDMASIKQILSLLEAHFQAIMQSQPQHLAKT